MTDFNSTAKHDDYHINSRRLDKDVPRFDSLIEAINSLGVFTGIAKDKAGQEGQHSHKITSLDDVMRQPVSGGDINDASLLTLHRSSGSDQSESPKDKSSYQNQTSPQNQTKYRNQKSLQVFLKQNTLDKAPILYAEVDGLTAIRNTGARTCQPLAYGVDRTLHSSFLLLSVIHPYQGSNTHQEAGWHDLATQLATLHLAVPPQPEHPPHHHTTTVTNDAPLNHEYATPWYAGWFDDNFIGSSPQRNGWTANWHEFFAEQRLGVQAQMAYDHQRINRQTLQHIERLQQNLPHYLPDYPVKDDSGQPRPSLLHGDLWAGNAMLGQANSSSDGDALNVSADSNINNQQPLGYLIDPAVYVGHPETDLAMTQLFGGFDSAFYEAYLTHGLTQAGFTDRVDIYNLYHYLNHLNLFGGGYLGAVQRIAKRYGG